MFNGNREILKENKNEKLKNFGPESETLTLEEVRSQWTLVRRQSSRPFAFFYGVTELKALEPHHKFVPILVRLPLTLDRLAHLEWFLCRLDRGLLKVSGLLDGCPEPFI